MTDIEAVELFQMELPMVEAMSASHGSMSTRRSVLVRIHMTGISGWGECAALDQPGYTSHYSDGEWAFLDEVLVPTLLATGEYAPAAMAHQPAVCAVEMALLDAELRGEQRSLSSQLGGYEREVMATGMVGLVDGTQLLASIERQISLGYKQMKMKIAPGRDIERLLLAQSVFPGVVDRVDANGSYDPENADHMRALHHIDEMNLALIEQPTREPSAQVCKALQTLVALDESIDSVETATAAIAGGTCDALVVKPALLGGLTRARQVVSLATVPVYVGGMVETGIGRAANLALAAGTTHSAEVAPDGRWFETSVVTEPVALHNGRMSVPDAPGLGVEVDTSVVERLTVRRSLHQSLTGTTS